MADTTFSNGTTIESSWLNDVNDHVYQTQATDAHAADKITFTPAGSIAATDVQAAIQELDSEAASRTETLTNKTIDLTDNTLAGTTAEFNAALSDGDFATLAGTESFTNKTITSTTNTVYASAGPGNSPLSHRNKLINGSFDVWQRGTSFAASASAAIYTADRWAFYRDSLVTGATVSRQTGSYGRYAYRVQRDSGNTSTNRPRFGQILETYNTIPLAGKTVTFSCKVKAGANFSGVNLVVYFQYGTGEDQGNLYNHGLWTGSSSNAAATIVPTTSYQTFTLTGTVPAGTKEMAVIFYWDPTGTAGTDDWVQIEEAQLEVGDTYTPFEYRFIEEELSLCLRYYYRMSSTGGITTFGPARGASATLASCLTTFPVTLRTAPTAIEQSGTATDYTVSGITCSSVPTFGSSSIYTANTTFTVAAGLTASYAYTAQTTVNGAYLAWSAEL